MVLYTFTMRFRKAKIEDAAELARLHRTTIRTVNSQDYSEDVIEGWVGKSTAKTFRDFHDKSIRFVAVENEKIIAFGELVKETGNLGAMYVHKDWIGKGIGKKLFEILENEAVKLGVTKFEFESSTTAKKFYESCGCKTIKKIKHTLRTGAVMDAYTMQKELS